MTEHQHISPVLLGGSDTPVVPAFVASPAMPGLVAPKAPRNRRRNAAPKRAKPRFRNAAAPPTPRASAAGRNAPVRMSISELAIKVAASALGSAGSSVLGGNAVKLGIPPLWTSLGLGLVGTGIAGLATSGTTREVGTGWLSAVASQLVLMSMSAPAKPTTVVVAQQSPPAPRPKNADLGTLPPGALDSAFERARAELAVRGDGYADGYQAEYHSIPFVPV